MNKKVEAAIEDGWLKKEPIVLADKKFYTFHDDGFKQTQARFEAFSDVLAKHEAFRTTQDDVDATVAGLKESIKLASLDIKSNPTDAYDALQKASLLIANFEARMKLGNPLERSMELASFLFIGEEENPLEYDFELNKAKIAEWKKKADTVLPVVLETVLPNFLTWSGFFQLHFLNSMRGNLQESLNLLMQISMSTSLSGADKETRGTFSSRMETITSLDSYYLQVLKNITDTRLNSSSKSKDEGQNQNPENTENQDSNGRERNKASDTVGK